jgi:hypothetical protein
MSELRTNRIVPRDGLPSGSSGGIIQVKSVSKSDTFSSNSTSYTDVTGLSVSITPTRADSKILVMMHVQIGHDSDVAGFLRLMRDSTAIAVGTDVSSRIACTVGMFDDALFNTSRQGQIITNFLDSPASTSSQTYGFKFRHAENGSMTCYLNRNHNDGDSTLVQRPISSITLYEVSG